MRTYKTIQLSLVLLTAAVVAGGNGEPAKATDIFGLFSAAFRKPEPATKVGKELARIAVTGSDKKGKLQSFVVDSQGRLVTAIAGAVSYGEAQQPNQSAKGEVQILSSDGKQLHAWTVPFSPQRVAVGANDEVFVGGDGQLARYSSTGKLILQRASPHLAEALGDRERLRKAAEEERQSSLESYQEQIERFEEQIKALEKQITNKPAEPAADKPNAPPGADDEGNPHHGNPAAMKKMYEQMISTYRRMRETVEKQSVDDFIVSITRRLQRIHALTVDGKEVFVATAMPKGYGFAVWRTDLDFAEPKQITGGLSGCCGQMDIQARNGELFVAENSKKRVCRFDRDGKRLGQFGKADREGEGASFGGCCNPMNLCFTQTGELLTAESEGRVKRFTQAGDFKELTAQAQVKGGCKNVAIGMAPDGQRIYFFNLDNSEIIVLVPHDGSETPPAVKNET